MEVSLKGRSMKALKKGRMIGKLMKSIMKWIWSLKMTITTLERVEDHLPRRSHLNSSKLTKLVEVGAEAITVINSSSSQVM